MATCALELHSAQHNQKLLSEKGGKPDDEDAPAPACAPFPMMGLEPSLPSPSISMAALVSVQGSRFIVVYRRYLL